MKHSPTHEDIVTQGLLEILEDMGEDLDKDKKDGIIMLLIEMSDLTETE